MKGRSKFNNVKTVVDGLPFDSKKEAARWIALVAMQRSGTISGLRRQVRIPIRVNDVIVCRYVADFVYVEAGQRIVEDVKSSFTRMNPVYRLKKKMLAAMGVEIREA